MKKILIRILVTSSLLGISSLNVDKPIMKSSVKRLSNTPVIDNEREFLLPVGLGNGNFTSDLFGQLNYVETHPYKEQKVLALEREQKKFVFWYTTVPSHEIYDDFISKSTSLYKFSKYVDLPIHIIKSPQLVAPGGVFDVTFTETYSYVNTFESTNTISSTISSTFTHEMKTSAEVGAKDIAKVGAEHKYAHTLSASMTGTVSERISNTYTVGNSMTTHYGPIVNNNDMPMYYEINYRQKFSLYYAITSTAYYTETDEYDDWITFSETDDGKTRIQRKYRDITFNYYKAEAFYFLVPEDPIYDTIDLYYDDPNSGDRIYIDTNPNQYIIRFGTGSSIILN